MAAMEQEPEPWVPVTIPTAVPSLTAITPGTLVEPIATDALAAHGTSRQTDYVPRMIVGALILALIGSLVWGVSTKGDLDTTKTTLASTVSELGTTQAALTTERQHSDVLTTENSRLASQAERQSACLSELRAEQSDMVNLLDRNRDNFNASAKDSVLGSARTAMIGKLVDGLDDYQKAWSAAYDGLYSSSNSWAAKGNAALSGATTDAATMNAAIAKVDAETVALASAAAALAGRLNASAITCAASTSSNPSS